VTGPDDFQRVEPGDVLVAKTTAPAYNVLLPMLGAVVTARGGVLSHAAVVAREYGLPAVVGCGEAMIEIVDGTQVRVDGDAGAVWIEA
jgi:pyruvate,water dikinase